MLTQSALDRLLLMVAVLEAAEANCLPFENCSSQSDYLRRLNTRDNARVAVLDAAMEYSRFIREIEGWMDGS